MQEDKTVIMKADMDKYVFGSDVVVPRTWSTKADEGAAATTVNGVISFAGLPVGAPLTWATSDRVIARQRVERIMKVVPTSVVVPAATAGRKIKTDDEIIEESVKASASMSDEAFQAQMEKLEAMKKARGL